MLFQKPDLINLFDDISSQIIKLVSKIMETSGDKEEKGGTLTDEVLELAECVLTNSVFKSWYLGSGISNPECFHQQATTKKITTFIHDLLLSLLNIGSMSQFVQHYLNCVEQILLRELKNQVIIEHHFYLKLTMEILTKFIIYMDAETLSRIHNKILEIQAEYCLSDGVVNEIGTNFCMVINRIIKLAEISDINALPVTFQTIEKLFSILTLSEEENIEVCTILEKLIHNYPAYITAISQENFSFCLKQCTGSGGLLMTISVLCVNHSLVCRIRFEQWCEIHNIFARKEAVHHLRHVIYSYLKNSEMNCEYFVIYSIFNFGNMFSRLSFHTKILRAS